MDRGRSHATRLLMVSESRELRVSDASSRGDRRAPAPIEVRSWCLVTAAVASDRLVGFDLVVVGGGDRSWATREWAGALQQQSTLVLAHVSVRDAVRPSSTESLGTVLARVRAAVADGFDGVYVDDVGAVTDCRFPVAVLFSAVRQAAGDAVVICQRIPDADVGRFVDAWGGQLSLTAACGAFAAQEKHNGGEQ